MLEQTYEYQLARECEILEYLLENSTDESQAKAIREMLCEIAHYLNESVK